MVTNETFDMLHDKAFRQSVYSDPRACAQKLGYELDDSVEVVVKTNSKDTMYIAIDTEASIDLNQIQAAGPNGQLGCVSSAGSVSTASTVTTTLSTGSTLGSTGTASTT